VGILVLGSVMMGVAFLAALATAAFFATHFWRLQRTYERDHQQSVAYATGKTPLDYQPLRQERAVRMFDDASEARIEQEVAERMLEASRQ